jgi:hypothetical protein
VATSYGNPGGTGDRTWLIGITTGGQLGGDSSSLLVDGNELSAGFHFTSAGPAANCFIIFAFAGVVVIDEAIWHQSTATPQGVWQWQGSNDVIEWTDIGASFNLGGVPAIGTHTTLHGNVTPYRYYRLQGVSGTTNTTGWLYEIQFRIDVEPAGEPETEGRVTQDVAEVAIERDAAHTGVRDTTEALEVVLERDALPTRVRETTVAVEHALERAEDATRVRVTQECIEVVLTPPKEGGTFVPPLPLPLQQQVFDERFLMTEPWRGFFSGLLGAAQPKEPLPMQQAVTDERRLVTVPWIQFVHSLIPKFEANPLPIPVQQQLTDDRLLMTVPWVLFFLWLLTRRRAGGGDIEEFMPNIVFMDSFDHYGTNDLHLKYHMATEGLAAIVPGGGRNGTNCLAVSGQNDVSRLRLSGLTGNTYYLEFAFNPGPNVGPPGVGDQVVAFRDSGTAQIELRMVATGQFSITRNSVILGQTEGFAFGTNQWRHVGLYVKIDGSIGEVTLTIDSVPILELTGLDTQNSGFPRITELLFFSLSNNNAVANYFDDLILSTDGFCSDSRVAAVFPKANGFWTQWFTSPNAYTYVQGAGNRVGEITVTQNATGPMLSGVLDNLVDGNPSSSCGFGGDGIVNATKFIRFDFGAGAARNITEARVRWSRIFFQGIWQWQGSNDAAAWTNIGASFTLGNTSGDFDVWQTLTTLSGNAADYRYYQMRGVDGSAAAAGIGSLQEIEFYIDDARTPAVELWENVDEHDSNEDDDYNWSVTAGHRVSYDFEALNLTGTVKGVQHVATMRKDDDRIRLVQLFTRIGTTDYDGSDISVNDTFVAQRKVWVTNPATGLPWEVSEVDSAEFGTLLDT